jgi:hypothetical protein
MSEPIIPPPHTRTPCITHTLTCSHSQRVHVQQDVLELFAGATEITLEVQDHYLPVEDDENDWATGPEYQRRVCLTRGDLGLGIEVCGDEVIRTAIYSALVVTPLQHCCTFLAQPTLLPGPLTHLPTHAPHGPTHPPTHPQAPFQISNVVENKVAWKSSNVFVRDIILEVNGTPVEGLTHDQVRTRQYTCTSTHNTARHGLSHGHAHYLRRDHDDDYDDQHNHHSLHDHDYHHNHRHYHSRCPPPPPPSRSSISSRRTTPSNFSCRQPQRYALTHSPTHAVTHARTHAHTQSHTAIARVIRAVFSDGVSRIS